MVRSALASKNRIGKGPIAGAAYVPAESVVAGIMLSALPIIVSTGWFPDFGFLFLIAWRLLRDDVWPSWWAAPLGLLNDLVTGAPVGLSVTVWTSAMLALDLLDRRTIWRGYWTEWALASLLVLFDETARWLASGWVGAPVPFAFMVPPILISIATFPITARIVGGLDAWRLRRQ